MCENSKKYFYNKGFAEAINKSEIHTIQVEDSSKFTTDEGFYYIVNTEKENLLVIYVKITVKTACNEHPIINISGLEDKNYTLDYMYVNGTGNAYLHTPTLSNGKFTASIDVDYGYTKSVGTVTCARCVYTFI